MTELFFDFSFEHWPALLLSLAPALINIAIFLYVLLFIKRSSLSTAFLFFLFTLILWRMQEAVLQICVSIEAAKMWYHMFAISTNFIGATGLHFVLVLIHKEKWKGKHAHIVALYLPTFLFSMFFASGIEYMDFNYSSTWGWLFTPSHPISIAAFVLIGIHATAMMVLLATHTWKLKQAASKEYTRTLIILLGSSAPIVVGCTYQILLPIFFNAAPVPIASSVTIFFSFSILVAITKYDFLEYSPMHQWDDIVENMNEGILIVDNDDAVQYVNNKFCEMLGYSRSELINKRASGMFMLPEGKIVENKMAERQRNIFRDHYELTMKKKDGSLIVCEINAQPYLDQNNKVVGSVGIHTDITYRKKAEVALRLSESRLKEAQSVANIGSWEMDIKTQQTKWSDEHYRIFGITPQKVIPSMEFLLSLIHPEDVDRFKRSLEQTFDSSDTEYIGYRIIRPDGTVRHLYSTSKFMRDKEGVPLRMYGITQDVTKNKLAEQQLEFEHRNQEALINNTIDLMWSVDADLKLITCNQAFNQFVKMISGENISIGESVLGKGFTEFQLTHWKELYRKALSGEAFTIVEHSEIPFQGWSEISFSPIENAGKIIGTACYSRDITERTLREMDLKEKVNEMDAFIYRASHDLRGPLASISGLTAIGKEEIKDSQAAFYFDKIRESALRLDDILLELSKIARVTQAKIEPSEIDLNKEVSDILESLKHLPNFPLIEFKREIKSHVLLCDKILLVIALQNLIINAINYYDERKDDPYIHIRVLEKAEGVEIMVSDNGIGIPASIHEKVFEMFFRGSTSSKGSGLGLYIVKNAVKKLSGSVTLESKEGEGTSFLIKLPGNVN